MRKISRVILGAIISLVIIISSMAAFAAPATSNTALNVRTGPGVSFSVVDTLYAGERVEVTECVSNRWCRIEHTGPDGWVSSNYLTPITSGGSGSSGGSGGSSNPDCSFGITIGSGGPSFSFSCGDPSTPTPPAPPPPPPPVADKACFFKGNNYTGTKSCIPANVSRPNMPASWNNALSSFTLSGNAKVKLCQGVNFTGLCTVYSSNRAVLVSALNNKVSSYEVFTGATPTPPAPPSPVAAKVCFYKGNGYTGTKACANSPFTRSAVTPLWDNSISSFKLYGGAKVKLCQGTNFTGLCSVYTNNKSVLNASLNNKISSYQVFTGSAPAPVAPATPVTYSTGPINLSQTWSADLDTGNVGGAGADIWYQAQTAVQKFIVPRNGAKLSVSGLSNRGLAGCSTASYSGNKISIWTLPVGTYICAKTNEGRISEFRLNGYTGTTMRLGYTTWTN